MPWNNQNNGGPWGNPGGGPNGPSGGGGPWSGGGGSGGGGGTPPNLEEMLKRSQDRLRDFIPGAGRGMGGRGIFLVILVLIGLWLATGFYRVEPEEVGVELLFGRVTDQTPPGLNYNWPYPVGDVYTPAVLRIRQITVGVQEFGTGSAARSRDIPEESQMLTGDENIVDVDFKVQWRILNTRQGVQNFLFNIQNPVGTVKAVAESAMREVVGRSNIDDVLTEFRAPIQQAVIDVMQSTLDSYNAGIEITEVQMQQVDPPQQVIDAFRDVQAARADEVRIQNEAQAYANRVVPTARGEAARILEAANAYRDQTVAEARGQAERFLKIYQEYSKAPIVTRERLYLETMEEILIDTNKIIIDETGAGQGVVPYLPLGELSKNTNSARAQ